MLKFKALVQSALETVLENCIPYLLAPIREIHAKLAKLDPSLTFDWSAEAHEHYLPYSDENEQRAMIFYPSLMSIATRLDLAAKLKVGISIWEIGQGLDYFYDLF